MADSSGGSDGKKKMNEKVICSIGTGGLCVVRQIIIPTYCKYTAD